MAWLIVPFAILAGALTTLQAGSNAALKKSLGEPLPALLINYVLGIGIVVLANIVSRQPWPGFDKLSGVPWWAWIGGLAGAVYGLTAILFAYRLQSSPVRWSPPCCSTTSAGLALKSMPRASGAYSGRF